MWNKSMRLCRLMKLGLAVATMVAIIPVATRGQIPTIPSQIDRSVTPLDGAKLAN
ncbi:MAG: hypothetical protein JWP26_4105 [Devosia sp.]|nr:hypothetical protein [Devosia sp.]